jgi:putative ATP-dependent endonuclease of OLD family
MLDEQDIEHCFWAYGFSDVITRVANLPAVDPPRTPTSTIHHAIDRTSKPYLALALVEAAADRGPSSVPPPLRNVIESAVQIARSGSP